MKLFLEVIVLCCGTIIVCANQNFEYEKMHNFGIGRRAIPNFRRMAYENPEPLPSSRMPDIALMSDPFPKLYQGVRRKSFDKRVFKKEFDYPASDVAHKILCETLMHCKITHLAIETEEGIPIILRGGVGYYHVSIVVRAKPGNPLKGSIGVYCNKDLDDETSHGL